MFKFYQILIRHKTIALLAVLLFFGGISYLASRITLQEDVTSLIPAGERQDILMKILEETEFSDKIIVSISSTEEEPNPELLTDYAERFLDSVNDNLPQYINDIQGKVPEEGIREIYDFVYENLPLFLNEADYREIQTRLQQDSIQERLRDNYKVLISPTGLVTKEYIFKDPLSLTTLGLSKLEELQVGEDFILYNNFLLTRDQRHLLLFISPALPASETDRNNDFLNGLENITKNLNSEYEDVNGDFFGGVLYSVANAQQIKNDIKITISIAAVILLLLLIFYYRKIYVPLVLFLPSVLGGIVAIAILYLLKGTISAISLGIGAILLGISIDYSLHILTHYKNNNNIEKLYRDVTGPVLMSSITTGVAFLCLLFVQSEALNDLGIFAAISVVVASIFALVLIPVLYRTQKVPATEKVNFVDKAASYEFHQNNVFVIILFLLFLGGIFFFTGVEFNNNLSALNYEPEEIKQKEQRVEAIAGRAAKSVYLVSYGNSIDDALETNNDLYRDLSFLAEEGEISNFSSIGGVVLSTSTQLNKIEQWQEFWTAEKKEQVRQDLISESEKLGFKPESFNQFYELLSQDFDPIYLEDYRSTTSLYLDDFISSSENFATVTTTVNVEPENLDEVLEEIRLNENVEIIDRQQMNEGFLGSLKDDFNNLIGYSILAVFLILLMFYRSLELTLLTVIPIGITWVIALGFMSVMGIEFNILNIIISTFIFGLGLDYSIFITNAFLKEYEIGLRVLKTYRTSILLSVFTTLLGIGALFFAQHPALRSISVVSVIGVVSAVLVAFILQSFLLQKLFLDRVKSGRAPYSLNNLFNFSRSPGGKTQLYHKKEVLDNYRYKKVFPEVKRAFEINRERYLKLEDFLEDNDRVLHLNSGYGVLPIFLHYKRPQIKITGVEPEESSFAIARQCFATNSKNLDFLKDLPEDASFDVLIISGVIELEIKDKIDRIISRKAKKVIILDSGYSYRWITDLNFEITYRQNEIVILKKLD